MGWKWGIKWTDEFRKLKYFKSTEEQELLDDFNLVSDIHDIDFENKTWITILKSISNFLKSNYDLIIRLLRLLHWTTVLWRLLIFIVAFWGLNIFWIKYFNWK